MGTGDGGSRGGTREWADVIAALAAAVGDGWRAGATALWAAGRRREASWLRADHQAAGAVLRGAAGGRPRDVVGALRRCRVMARQSAAHRTLAAPWRDAARLLAVAAGVETHDHAYPAAIPVGERRRSSDASGATAVA